MPRSSTSTERPVAPVSSFAMVRPVPPPPMMATSTGLRFVMFKGIIFPSGDIIGERRHTSYETARIPHHPEAGPRRRAALYAGARTVPAYRAGRWHGQCAVALLHRSRGACDRGGVRSYLPQR